MLSFNLSGPMPEERPGNSDRLNIYVVGCNSRTEMYRQWFRLRKNRIDFKGFGIEEICRIQRELEKHAVDIMELQPLIHRDQKLFSHINAVCALSSDWFWCISEMKLPWSHALKFSSLPSRLLRNLKAEYLERSGNAKLTSSGLRIHLQLLHDLQKRGLSEPELVKLQQAEFNIPGSLQMARTPHLSKRKEKLQSIQASTLKHSGISIALPDNLEGDRIRLSFSVRNGAELNNKLTALKNLTEEMDHIERILFE